MQFEVTIPKNMIRELGALKGAVNDSEVVLDGCYDVGYLRFNGFRGRHVGKQLYRGILCFEAAKPSPGDRQVAFDKLLNLIGGK